MTSPSQSSHRPVANVLAWLALCCLTASSRHTDRPTHHWYDQGDPQYDLLRIATPLNESNENTVGNINTFYSSLYPQAIVLAHSSREVASAVRYAGATNRTVSPRSGGHAYDGCSLSGAVVVDVSRIRHVHLNHDKTLVKIGAGAKLGDVYRALGHHQLTIPAGSCFTVGIAGLTLGGGQGVLSRSHGLSIDSVVSAEVVTADGTLRVVNETHDADLFWGLRGGGNGNIGVVTEFEFRVVPAWSWHFYKAKLRFNASVLHQWQRWANNESRHSWHAVHLLRRDNYTEMQVLGLYRQDFTSLEGVRAHVKKQLNLAEEPWGISYNWEQVYQTMNWAPDNKPHDWIAQSAMPTESLEISTLEKVAAFVEAAPPGATLKVNFDALGGAVADVPAGATAFPHRNALFSIQFLVDFTPESDGNAIAGWLQQLSDGTAMGDHGAYRNYASTPGALGQGEQRNQMRRFYGDNLIRLQAVKEQYDKNGMFSSCAYSLNSSS